MSIVELIFIQSRLETPFGTETEVVGWGAKSGLGNPGVQALGAHSEQLE